MTILAHRKTCVNFLTFNVLNDKFEFIGAIQQVDCTNRQSLAYKSNPRDLWIAFGKDNLNLKGQHTKQKAIKLVEENALSNN